MNFPHLTDRDDRLRCTSTLPIFCTREFTDDLDRRDRSVRPRWNFSARHPLSFVLVGIVSSSMSMVPPRVFSATLALLASLLPLHGAAEPLSPPLAHATLAPSLKAAAERDGVPLYQLDQPDGETRNGDRTVAWIAARDGDVTRQWLVQFRRGTATPREQKTAHRGDKTKYLSWGTVVAFKSTAQALDLWIAGPVTVTDKPADSPAVAPVKHRRILVPVDYLRLGLDNSLRVEEHIRRRTQALQKEDPQFKVGHLYSLEKPIKPERIPAAKAVADKIGFSPEMERAWMGGYVALQAFYKLANEVPEIEPILAVALDKPAVWKLVKMATGTMFKTSLGGSSSHALDPAKKGLIPVATESFDAPFLFQFGDHMIVKGRMVVSAPIPPFDTTAGVLAVVAVHPKDSTRVVHLAVITAVRGESTPKPSP